MCSFSNSTYIGCWWLELCSFPGIALSGRTLLLKVMCPCWLQPASNNMSVVFKGLTPWLSLWHLWTASWIQIDPCCPWMAGAFGATAPQFNFSLRDRASVTSLHGIFPRRQANKPPVCESQRLCPGSLMEAYFHIDFPGQLGRFKLIMPCHLWFTIYLIWNKDERFQVRGNTDIM